MHWYVEREACTAGTVVIGWNLEALTSSNLSMCKLRFLFLLASYATETAAAATQTSSSSLWSKLGDAERQDGNTEIYLLQNIPTNVGVRANASEYSYIFF